MYKDAEIMFSSGMITPLMLAAGLGEVIDARNYIALFPGIVNAQDVLGRTAVQWAIESDAHPLMQAAMLRCLALAGADLDRGSVPPLIVAIRRYHFASAAVLIELGADVDATDRCGNSVLMYATMTSIKTGDPYAMEVVNACLQRGADRSLKNVQGYTALAMAVQSAVSADIVRLLASRRVGDSDIEHQSMIDSIITSSSGRRASLIQIAMARKDRVGFEIVGILLGAGADVVFPAGFNAFL